MSLPWETHYTGCTRRHPAVAYPRHACEECRAYERGLTAASDAVAALPANQRRSNEDGMGGYVQHADGMGTAVSHPETFTEYLTRSAALAAIDALRGES